MFWISVKYDFCLLLTFCDCLLHQEAVKISNLTDKGSKQENIILTSHIYYTVTSHKPKTFHFAIWLTHWNVHLNTGVDKGVWMKVKQRTHQNTLDCWVDGCLLTLRWLIPHIVTSLLGRKQSLQTPVAKWIQHCSHVSYKVSNYTRNKSTSSWTILLPVVIIEFWPDWNILHITKVNHHVNTWVIYWSFVCSSLPSIPYPLL